VVNAVNSWLDPGTMQFQHRCIQYWGRCYDHNFRRILPIFGEKMPFFTKPNVMIKFLQKLAVVWAKKRQYFRRIFRRKYLFNHNIDPGLVTFNLYLILRAFGVPRVRLSGFLRHVRAVWGVRQVQRGQAVGLDQRDFLVFLPSVALFRNDFELWCRFYESPFRAKRFGTKFSGGIKYPK
jgi:hypothetical protein